MELAAKLLRDHYNYKVMEAKKELKSLRLEQGERVEFNTFNISRVVDLSNKIAKAETEVELYTHFCLDLENKILSK